MFAHLIKGRCLLRRTRGVLIPSPCVKQTPEPFILKVHRPAFWFFQHFPQINVVATPLVFSLVDKCFGPFILAFSHPHRRVGCDRRRVFLFQFLSLFLFFLPFLFSLFHLDLFLPLFFSFFFSLLFFFPQFKGSQLI